MLFSFSEAYADAISTPMHEIETHLWLGNLKAATDLPLLRSHNISAIVQVLDNEPEPLYRDEFTYFLVDLIDSPTEDILRIFEKTLAFIEKHIQSGLSVLVHCKAGMSRSATVVIAYLMAKHKMSYKKAFYKVRDQRPCISPNSGFAMQLCSMDLGTLEKYINV